MQCDDQRSIRLDKPKPDGRGGLIYYIPVNCGKCMPCKRNRVNMWSFRLMQELKRSESAYFVTLTYSTENVPLTNGNCMTLLKTSEQDKELRKQEIIQSKKNEKEILDRNDRSLQGFIKRLRYYENDKETRLEEAEKIGRKAIPKQKKVKYYAVGEYGTNRKRPHYHLIIFNLRGKKSIEKAWELGGIHIDEVNNNTIDYTLKYMNKPGNGLPYYPFDGIKEFSTMSKDLGSNYLTKESKKYHRKNLDINYLYTERGYKIPMPKYYRDKILPKKYKDKQLGIIKQAMEEQEEKRDKEIERAGLNPAQVKQDRKQDRYEKMNKQVQRSID